MIESTYFRSYLMPLIQNFWLFNQKFPNSIEINQKNHFNCIGIRFHCQNPNRPLLSPNLVSNFETDIAIWFVGPNRPSLQSTFVARAINHLQWTKTKNRANKTKWGKQTKALPDIRSTASQTNYKQVKLLWSRIKSFKLKTIHLFQQSSSK